MMDVHIKARSAIRVPVLMYHRVEASLQPAERRYAVTGAQFAAQLDWLAAHDWRPCTMAAFLAWYQDGASLPERSVLITFDDGFACLHAQVLPQLAQRGWPASVFLVSALTGGRENWLAREQQASAAAHALLSAAQITEMAAAGFEFHSHSRHHARLTELDDARLTDEVAGSRAELQQLLGTTVEAIAYPYGGVDKRVRQAVAQAGYRLGFGVEPGFNRAAGPTMDVRRLDITGFDTPRRFGRKLNLGTNDGSLSYQLRYMQQEPLRERSLAWSGCIGHRLHLQPLRVAGRDVAGHRRPAGAGRVAMGVARRGQQLA